MLEILVLWSLARKIGRTVEQRGYKSTRYIVLTVLFWFGGELTGAVLASQAPVVIQYIVALVGAALGAGIAYLAARNLKPQGVFYLFIASGSLVAILGFCILMDVFLTLYFVQAQFAK